MTRRKNFAKSKYKTSVMPGIVSPTRVVPSNIPLPPYVPGNITLPKPPLELDEKIKRMRQAGIAAREVMLEVKKFIKPGITTDQIDELVHNETIKRGAYPSPLLYGKPPFPKSVCTSVNEVICHGIPDSRKLVDGDICNVDITVYLNGVHGDHNETFLVGNVDEESKRLVDVTKQALWLGISQVKPGEITRGIGRVIEEFAKENGYSSVRDYTGHGIGEQFHCAPTILHYDTSQNDAIMMPGMTFTIEPMLTIGDWRSKIWDDSWTVVTKDNSRSAQFEHTCLVTETGVEVLTLLPEEPRLFPS
ncbi:MAG: type I methionyl aminopeptidase [Acidimicrobiia bacterium]